MSDPSAIQIPISTAVSSDLLLGLKPSAPKSRSYRISIPPINKSSFFGQDMIVFELPTGRRGNFYDPSQSYLKFSVQVQTTADVAQGSTGVYLDNSAYSFFQRLDIYNGSNLLEQISNYGDLCNALIDTSLTMSDKAGLSALIGTNDKNTYGSLVAPAQYTSLVAVQTAGDRSGLSLAGDSTASDCIPYTFCLPLLSGVIGANSSKCIPVGQLNAPIRCEMTLASNDDAIYYGLLGAGAKWTITNVEFNACYIELYDDVLNQQYQQGIPQYISTQTYRQASAFIASASSGELTLLLPFRCASLQSLMARFRNQSTAIQGVNASASYRRGSSISGNFAQISFRIGSSIYPNKPIVLVNSITGTGSEAYAEMMKANHSLSSTVGNSAITYSMYNVSQTAQKGWGTAFAPGRKDQCIQDTHNNAFIIALETQSFSNRNDTILSGISTLNSQIFANITTVSGSTVGVDLVADFYAGMDMILVIQDGIMSAKF